MKVMLLAAGKGTRMQPLTEKVPKPLLQAGGCSLIEHQIRKLKAAGFGEFVINHAWLGKQLEQAFGDGSSLGVNIQWSPEDEPLETAGGINQALPLLGRQAFAVVNADVWTDYPFNRLHAALAREKLAHLVLVPNPVQHPAGDFVLQENAEVQMPQSGNAITHTFSGIAVYHPDLFAAVPARKFPLLPLLQQAMSSNSVSGELYAGTWMDIGTPQRLQALDDMLSGRTDR
jgi:N-acetyl-alpha-D-muramate 1-phosphate uridylyltransferase